MRSGLFLFLLGSLSLSALGSSAHQSSIISCASSVTNLRPSFKLEDFFSKSWIDKRFTLPFLKVLSPLIDDEDLMGLNREKLLQISSLAFKNIRGQEVNFEMQLFTHEVAGNKVLVPVIAMRCGSALCGMLTLSIRKKSDATYFAQSEYLKTNARNLAIQGIGPHIMPMLKEYYTKLGVKEERLEAGWSGRERWAKEGFVLDPDLKFLENGIAVDQISLIRNNFKRFLSFHKIALSDLYLEESDGKKTLLDENLSQLKQPIDFQKVFHNRGKKIMTRSYVDVDTLAGPRPMAPGLSFTLWDYRPRDSQESVILQEGKPLSDMAMPTWIGLRRFE